MELDVLPGDKSAHHCFFREGEGRGESLLVATNGDRNTIDVALKREQPAVDRPRCLRSSRFVGYFEAALDDSLDD